MAKLNLGKRERIVVIVGIVSLSLMASSFLIKSARGAYSQAQNQLEAAKENLRHAKQLSATVKAEQRGHEAIKGKTNERPRGFSLFSFTTRTLTEVNLKERASLETDTRGTRSNLEVVRLELGGVSMKELVDFLHRIYAADNLIVVQKLEHLKPASDGKGLDCQMTFIMPKA